MNVIWYSYYNWEFSKTVPYFDFIIFVLFMISFNFGWSFSWNKTVLFVLEMLQWFYLHSFKPEKNKIVLCSFVIEEKLIIIWLLFNVSYVWKMLNNINIIVLQFQPFLMFLLSICFSLIQSTSCVLVWKPAWLSTFIWSVLIFLSAFSSDCHFNNFSSIEL